MSGPEPYEPSDCLDICDLEALASLEKWDELRNEMNYQFRSAVRDVSNLDDDEDFHDALAKMVRIKGFIMSAHRELLVAISRGDLPALASDNNAAVMSGEFGDL